MEKEQKITLKEFLDSNINLITVLGVFSALTVYFSGLQIQFFAGLLTSASLTCSVLVWMELWRQFPQKKGTNLLMWFENILGLGIFVLILFWLFTLNKYFGEMISILFAFLLLWIISLIIKHTDIFNKIFDTHAGGKDWLRYVIGWSILIVVFVGCVELSQLIYPPINRFFSSVETETIFTSSLKDTLNLR